MLTPTEGDSNDKNNTKQHSANQKKDSTWTRTYKQKRKTFAQHPSKVFQRFLGDISQIEEEKVITSYLDPPFQMTLPIKAIEISELKYTIQRNIGP